MVKISTQKIRVGGNRLCPRCAKWRLYHYSTRTEYYDKHLLIGRKTHDWLKCYNCKYYKDLGTHKWRK